MTDRVRKIMVETCDHMIQRVKNHPNYCGAEVKRGIPTHDPMVHARELGFWAGRRAVYVVKP